MTNYTVASWNIEKDGQSSTIEKQTKISSFVDDCINDAVDLIFLCEVHCARQQDFRDFLEEAYGDKGYEIRITPGGNSNAYVTLARVKTVEYYSKVQLWNLNRYLVLYTVGSFLVGLAHFKSGQTKQTKIQVQDAVSLLEKKQTGSWMLTGDMNWEYSNRDELDLDDMKNLDSYAMWDCTQKKGGILDWAIGGRYTSVSGYTPFKRHANEEYLNMEGPDHKPAIYSISRNSRNFSSSSGFSKKSGKKCLFL